MSQTNRKKFHVIGIRPPVNLFKILVTIAHKETRPIGPQALVFLEKGIELYLADHPEVKQHCQDKDNDYVFSKLR